MRGGGVAVSYVISIIPQYPCQFIRGSLRLQRLPHAANGDALNDHELINAVLAALTTEAALLDTTEPVKVVRIRARKTK